MERIALRELSRHRGVKRLSFASALVLTGALLITSCHRVIAPDRPQSLSGRQFSLIEGTALVVAGTVEGVPARVVLETAQPYTSVTSGCWQEGRLPHSPGSVRVPVPEGGWRELPEIEVRAGRVGDARLGARVVALVKGKGCTLTVGLDVLSDYALHVDPFRRLVKVTASAGPMSGIALRPLDASAEDSSARRVDSAGSPTEEGRPPALKSAETRGGAVAGLRQSSESEPPDDLPDGGPTGGANDREDSSPFVGQSAQPSTTQAETLTLTREPARDFLLITARLRQGDAVVTGPFVLSTGTQVSRLATGVGRGNGMTAGARGLTHQRPVPPQELLRAPFRVDSVELSPRARAEEAAVAASDEWKDALSLGVLAADVWGRFVTTIDVGAGVIKLWRPNEPSAQVLLKEGHIAAVSWSDVPGGMQLLLQSAASVEAEASCTFGVSFPEGSAGRTVKVAVPWESLAQKFPECAELIQQTSSMTIARSISGQHPHCAGTCVFASVTARGAVSCSCEAEPFLPRREEDRLMELWEKSLGADGGVPIVPGWADDPPEPEDP